MTPRSVTFRSDLTCSPNPARWRPTTRLSMHSTPNQGSFAHAVAEMVPQEAASLASESPFLQVRRASESVVPLPTGNAVGFEALRWVSQPRARVALAPDSYKLHSPLSYENANDSHAGRASHSDRQASREVSCQ
eukprot:scaffold10630_cov36-Prasinocladus_malaysianus.AAC.1